MEDKLNWLAYHSGVLTESFQRRHLIINYSILALGLVAYLIGAPVIVITLACLPGAAVFIVSLEALAWKYSTEYGDQIRTLLNRS